MGTVAPCLVPDALAATDTVTIADNDTTWNSTESINITDATSTKYGVYAAGTEQDSISITLADDHSITISSEDENTNAATFYGIYADRSEGNTVNNYGTINITAGTTGSYVRAYGIYARGDGSAANSITNDGEITAEATSTAGNAYAYGMHAISEDYYSITNLTNSITNNGTIDVTSWTSAGDVDATGMYAWSGTNTLINAENASITVSATCESSSTNDEAEAYGMIAGGDKVTLTNDGNITVTATSTNTYAYAYGMWASSDDNELTNNGTITVEATSTSGWANAYGMWADSDDNELTNDGNITVTATSTEGDAYAYGMYVSGATSTLNNFGTITVSASGSTAATYQAYVNSGTANIATWTLELKEDYGTDYVFGVGGDATLNFGVGGNGATFIITNESADGTLYAVADMISIESYTSTDRRTGETVTDTGEVTGYIAKVENDDYSFVEWYIVNADGTAYVFDSSATWKDQYISNEVIITEDNSLTQDVANQTVSSLSANLNQVRAIVSGQTRAVGQRFGFSKMNAMDEQSQTASMYADAGTTVSDAPNTSYMAPNAQEAPLWSVFAMPYYSQSGANNNDYDGHMYGIAMGATRQMTDDFSLGMHAAFSKGSSESDVTDTDATAYTLGVHAVYNVGESLFFRGQMSGFIAENEMDMFGSTAALTRADADMDTSGLYAMLAVGYDYVLATDVNGVPQHILTPELGLSYFYAHMDGFDTHFYNTSTGDKADSFGMESDSYDVWYTDATLRWTGNFAMDTGLLKPTVKVGVRQALSDPEVSSTMKFNAITATTHADANETAFLCEAGITWEMGDVDVSLTYSGEFGDVEYMHMGMFKAEWKF